LSTEIDIRKQADPEAIRRRVEELIRNFEAELLSGELRTKVLALIPIFHGLRELGKAVMPVKYDSSAKDRILCYFQK